MPFPSSPKQTLPQAVLLTERADAAAEENVPVIIVVMTIADMMAIRREKRFPKRNGEMRSARREEGNGKGKEGDDNWYSVCDLYVPTFRLEARDAKGTKKSKITRDRERDISEKIALGMAKVQTNAGEAMYDSRLFNQERGMTTGETATMMDCAVIGYLWIMCCRLRS